MGKGRPNLEVLKNRIEQRKKIEEEKKEIKILRENSALIESTDIDLTIANITNDEELNEKLRNFLLKYSNFGMSTNITLGQLYQELTEIFAGNNQYNGYYSKFLTEVLKVNPRTALRYKKRYILFSKVGTYSKKIISLITDKEVDFLNENPEIIEKIEAEKLKLSEVKEIISNNIINIQEKNNQIIEHKIEVPTFDFDKINNFLKNAKNIEESKRNKIFKLMNQINKLIEE
jgi:hypothetical protein